MTTNYDYQRPTRWRRVGAIAEATCYALVVFAAAAAALIVLTHVWHVPVEVSSQREPGDNARFVAVSLLCMLILAHVGVGARLLAVRLERRR